MLIKYMTPEEEEFPYTETKKEIVYGGFLDKKAGVLALRKGRQPSEVGRTLRHEIGHLKYPVDKEMSPWVDEEYENPVLTLFRELCTLYYSLKVSPRDPVNRGNIKLNKEMAVEEEGLTRKQVSGIDKIARERVGYTGREVS